MGDMGTHISRRTFVTSAALGVAGCGGANLGGGTPSATPPGDPSPPGATPQTMPAVGADAGPAGSITERTLAEAEKLLVVEYTAAERAQLLETIGGARDSLSSLRTRFQP